MKAITIVLIIILTIIFGATILHYVSLLFSLIAKGFEWLYHIVPWSGFFNIFE